MQKAACAVEEGLSLRKSAELYRVPKSTLYDCVMGRIKFGAKSGPDGYLTPVEEAELLIFLMRCLYMSIYIYKHMSTPESRSFQLFKEL